MRLLLDTHIFLWYVANDPRLAQAWRQAIRDSRNEVYLSVVSLWEAVIKYHTGSLPLPEAPVTYFPRQRRMHHILSLSIEEEDVSQVALLPLLHRDPFDRLLIGQAIQQGLTLVTVDASVQAYPTAPVL